MSDQNSNENNGDFRSFWTEEMMEQLMRDAEEQQNKETAKKVAKLLYEHYVAFLEAGFTDAQALFLVNEMFKALVAGAGGRS